MDLLARFRSLVPLHSMGPLYSHSREWVSWGQLIRRRCWQAMLDVIYPPQCIWCGELLVSARNWSLCPRCRTQVQPEKLNWCKRCGHSVRRPSNGESEDDCRECRGKRLPFEAVIVAGVYRGRLRQSVILAKQAEQAILAPVLARLMLAALRRHDPCWFPDLITHIPTYWVKRAVRGHCSPEMIASSIAERLHRPHQAVLVCHRPTKKQGMLSVAARQRNVRHAFAIAPGISDVQRKRILLVDDVMTTGATVKVAARMLKDAGASEVRVVVAARGTHGGSLKFEV